MKFKITSLALAWGPMSKEKRCNKLISLLTEIGNIIWNKVLSTKKTFHGKRYAHFQEQHNHGKPAEGESFSQKRPQRFKPTISDSIYVSLDKPFLLKILASNHRWGNNSASKLGMVSWKLISQVCIPPSERAGKVFNSKVTIISHL